MNSHVVASDTTVSTAIIYGLVDPRTSEVRYVGQTVDAMRRAREHVRPGLLTVRSRKVSWLKNLLDAGLTPDVVVLEEVPVEHADDAEREWIAFYRMYIGDELTNGTDGGDGGAVTDPEARARIAAAHQGTKASAETRGRMSASAKRAVTPDLRERRRLNSLAQGSKPPVHVGEKNPMARLSDAQVREIRERAAAGESGAALAREFDTTPATVADFLTGKHRPDAGGPIRPAKARTKLTEADVLEVRRLAAQGVSQTEIARSFKVGQSCISMVVSNRRRSAPKQEEFH